MLITSLLNLIAGILDLLLVFELPQLPEAITSIWGQMTGYFTTGIQVLRAFVGDAGMTVMGVLLGLVLLLHAAYLLYSVVFWVLRKIPVLGIKE